APPSLDAQCQYVGLDRVAGPPRRSVRPARSVVEVGRASAPALHGAPAHAHVASGARRPDALCFGDEEGARERRGASGAVQQKNLRLEVAGLNTATLVG